MEKTELIIEILTKKDKSYIQENFSVQDYIWGYNYCKKENLDEDIVSFLYKEMISKIKESDEIYVPYMENTSYPYIGKSKYFGTHILIFSEKEIGENYIKNVYNKLVLKKISGNNLLILCRKLLINVGVERILVDTKSLVNNLENFICFDIKHITGEYKGKKIFSNPRLLQKTLIYLQDVQNKYILQSVLDEEEQDLYELIKKSKFIVRCNSKGTDKIEIPRLKIGKDNIQPIFTDNNESSKWEYLNNNNKSNYTILDIFTILKLIKEDSKNNVDNVNKININPFGSSLSLAFDVKKLEDKLYNKIK